MAWGTGGWGTSPWGGATDFTYVGNVSLSLVPTSSVTFVGATYTYDGSVGLSFSPSSVLGVSYYSDVGIKFVVGSQEEVIYPYSYFGTAIMYLEPSSEVEAQYPYLYTTDVSINLTPSASASGDFSYTGNASLSLTPRHSARFFVVPYSGSASLALIPSGDLGIGLDGDVGFSLLPTGNDEVFNVYNGSVSIELRPSHSAIADYAYVGRTSLILLPTSIVLGWRCSDKETISWIEQDFSEALWSCVSKQTTNITEVEHDETTTWTAVVRPSTSFTCDN